MHLSLLSTTRVSFTFIAMSTASTLPCPPYTCPEYTAEEALRDAAALLQEWDNKTAPYQGAVLSSDTEDLRLLMFGLGPRVIYTLMHAVAQSHEENKVLRAAHALLSRSSQ
jgi:hypothetical protein